MRVRANMHCDKPMVERHGRAERDVYYVWKCRTCNYWYTQFLPVSEQDRR